MFSGLYLFLDDEVELLNICDMFEFGDGAKPNIQGFSEPRARSNFLSIHIYLMQKLRFT